MREEELKGQQQVERIGEKTGGVEREKLWQGEYGIGEDRRELFTWEGRGDPMTSNISCS